MNEYYEKLDFVKTKVTQYLKEIFKVNGNELLLQLEQYNLLSNQDNCIETSTAPGFIMEEFIVSKLEIYTANHDGENDIKILRLANQTTVNSSYDCYTYYKGLFVMINIKIQKAGSANNAVAAINILHRDYVELSPLQEKAFLVLKTHYTFGESKIDAQRKIMINDIGCFCLEEIDFSQGHKQDSRNWSASFNANSGRLQIPASWLINNKLTIEQISYNTTKEFIDDMFCGKNPII
ncbi:MAG: hypothetical protein IJB47_04895 [Oscillospiraceae bacterium]|nr:hypothetical protein [Oscillospiraceae bacterium]